MDTGFEQEYLAELTQGREAPEFHFATVGAMYADGVSLIFDGQTTPSQKHYKYNKSIQTMNPGDRVKIFRDSGTYVVEYVVGLPSYVWDIYSVKGPYTANTDSYPSPLTLPSGTRVYYATNYSLNQQTGKFTLTNPGNTTGNAQTIAMSGYLDSRYWIVGSSSGTDVYYYWTHANGDEITPQIHYYRTGSKGDATGQTVFSDDPNAYPANGIKGDYWYVLQT